MTQPFTEVEVVSVIKEMKENTFPDPDGFGVSFYKSVGGNKRRVYGNGE